MSHQNSSGLNLHLRYFFLSPSIFTPVSHSFCSFPWDSCSCSGIYLAVSCSWTNPAPLTAGVTDGPSFQCVSSCQVLESPATAHGAGLQIVNREKNHFPQLPGYSLSTTGGFQKCSDQKWALYPQIASVLTGLKRSHPRVLCTAVPVSGQGRWLQTYNGKNQ